MNKSDNLSMIGSYTQTRFRLEKDYPLSKLTTFGIGGPADWVAFCKSGQEVMEAVELCRSRQMEYFVVGGGSNILASDKGFRGMIIVPQMDTLKITGETVVCGAGYSLAKLVERTLETGLAGLESLSGIAGTLGGAVVGNAGAYGTSISDTLLDVDLYHPLKGLYIDKKENLGFRYRHSDLKWSGNIVLSARFQLKRDDRTKLQEEAKRILAERWKRHPHEDISAGSFFKNIESPDAPYGKIAAGYLLEQVGGKKISVGQAGVWPDHANILINKGGATASEMRELSLILKQKVKEAYGVELNEEVVLLGDFS